MLPCLLICFNCFVFTSCFVPLAAFIHSSYKSNAKRVGAVSGVTKRQSKMIYPIVRTRQPHGSLAYTMGFMCVNRGVYILIPLHCPIDIIHIDMLADKGGEFVVLLLFEGFVIEGGGGGGGVETFG